LGSFQKEATKETKKTDKPLSITLKTVLAGSSEIVPELEPLLPTTKLIDSVYLSGFNPPPSYRSL
jgi:hypothetical protein